MLNGTVAHSLSWPRQPMNDSSPSEASAAEVLTLAPSSVSVNAIVSATRAGRVTDTARHHTVSGLLDPELSRVSRAIGALGAEHPLHVFACLCEGDFRDLQLPASGVRVRDPAF